MGPDVSLKPETFFAIIDECARNGRRRSEIAAFLAREYELDAIAIAKLIAAHGALSAQRAVSAKLAGFYIAFIAFVQRHEQVDVPFVNFI